MAENETDIVTLAFSNADAKPPNTVIKLDRKSVRNVMEWYGAFYAGDRYTATLDGQNIPMDRNGATNHG